MRKILINIIIWFKKLFHDASQQYSKRYEPNIIFPMSIPQNHHDLSKNS